MQRTKHLPLTVLTLLIVCGFSSQLVAAASPPSPSPDPTHPRITQQAGAEVSAAKFAAPLAIGGSAAQGIPNGPFGPSREVFGFGLASSLADPTLGYPSWDFGTLTTVAFFGLHVQDDGTFAADSGWSVWNSSQLSGLVSTAHSKGTKVVLTIILQDFSPGTPHMCAGLWHTFTTVNNTVAEVKAKGVDGVNVDYEGLNGSCGTADPSWARHTFTNFVSGLRLNLPGAFLTVDTYASSATDPVGFFDISGMNASVDAFFVMAYDLEYSNYSRPPTSCSSFCLGPTAPLGGYYYNDTNTVSQYTSAVGASKVILGVPYYGRKACVASATPNATPTSAVVADMYLDASTETTSPDVKPGSYVTHRDANDPSGEVRWDTWFNTAMNCTRELYWDDTISLGHKYDLINSNNLRGVGIWTLNYGGGAPELWNLLASKFATTTQWASLNGILTSGPDASSWGAARVDVFARGTTNGIFQNTWNGTAWSGWGYLGGVLTSNPSAVSWGPNRIDLFARGTDNALYHRWWDGANWYGWESLGGNLSSGPDVASWGFGRLDIFARGTNNALIHKWWDGRQWSSWEDLGGILITDPTAVSWGPNRIDVFALGTNTALFHKWWDGSRWNGWESLGGGLSSAPDVASCSSNRLDVVALGTDHGLWRKSWNGSQWSLWQRLGGGWTSDPGAVCPPGSTSVQLFDRGSDNAIWTTSVPGS